jgi:hypothetical protein
MDAGFGSRSQAEQYDLPYEALDAYQLHQVHTSATAHALSLTRPIPPLLELFHCRSLDRRFRALFVLSSVAVIVGCNHTALFAAPCHNWPAKQMAGEPTQ